MKIGWRSSVIYLLCPFSGSLGNFPNSNSVHPEGGVLCLACKWKSGTGHPKYVMAWWVLPRAVGICMRDPAWIVMSALTSNILYITKLPFYICIYPPVEHCSCSVRAIYVSGCGWILFRGRALFVVLGVLCQYRFRLLSFVVKGLSADSGLSGGAPSIDGAAPGITRGSGDIVGMQSIYL